MWALDQDFTKVEGINQRELGANISVCQEACIQVPVCKAIEWHYIQWNEFSRCFFHTQAKSEVGSGKPYNLSDEFGRALFVLHRECIGSG